MDLRSLRYFAAAAEHGNILRASRALHVSQPALTKTIQNLEEELGVPLFDRGPRGVEPTIYGRILVGHAQAIVSQAQRAATEIAAVRDGHAGHLRLGVANFAIDFLPRVIARLMRESPGITFEVTAGSYETLCAEVSSGTLDAVLSGFPPLHRAPNLVHEPLRPHEFVVVASGAHPLARRSNVAINDLAAESWILANRPRAIVDILELEFRRAGLELPPPQLVSGSMMFVKALLLEGGYVSFLPRSVVSDELTSGRLARLRVSQGRRAQSVEGIIYRTDSVRPPALDRLVDAIRDEQLLQSG